MKPYVLYFDAPSEWNESDTEHRNKWVVGIFEDIGYRNNGSIEQTVEVLGIHDDFEVANRMLVELVRSAA